jgi:hypothetical protein
MGPEKYPSGLASIDAAAAGVKLLPTPPNHFRWTNTPRTRRLKVTFDGDWLSPRSKNRTRRTVRASESLSSALLFLFSYGSQLRVLGSPENFYRSLMIELDLELPRSFWLHVVPPPQHTSLAVIVVRPQVMPNRPEVIDHAPHLLPIRRPICVSA